MSYRLLTGDAIDQLRTLPAASVHCCVTSPPYWGLRDYGAAGQIGLEPTLGEWVERMREVFAEVQRVLRPDGTLWLNLGDAFAGSWGAQSRPVAKAEPDGPWARSLSARQIAAHPSETGTGSLKQTPGLKGKDLMGQPWRVAFALQADGWYLRADVIWAKPNPMPESITDRPTKSHEYVFLLSPSARYFYDADAVREPYKPESIARRAYRDVNVSERRSNHQPGGAGVRPPANDGMTYAPNAAGRNRRDVWEIAMQPFDGAHFATYPEALVEPCIMAGTSEAGCCAACGAPLVRHVEKGEPDAEHQAACGADANGGYNGISAKHGETAEDYDRLKMRRTGQRKQATGAGQNPSDVKARILAGMRERRTTGWDPTCECAAGVVPATVLDPFSGSATTGAVALRLGRHYVGIELNTKYQEEIARPRLEAIAAQGQLRFHEAQ